MRHNFAVICYSSDRELTQREGFREEGKFELNPEVQEGADGDRTWLCVCVREREGEAGGVRPGGVREGAHLGGHRTGGWRSASSCTPALTGISSL